MEKYTEIELSTMDFDFFFKKENQIIVIASNGQILDKFLALEYDKQNKLYEYFESLKDDSDFTINDESLDYPDNSSFTDWAKKGVYSYDLDTDTTEEVLAAIPTKPLELTDLPSEILELLTEFSKKD